MSLKRSVSTFTKILLLTYHVTFITTNKTWPNVINVGVITFDPAQRINVSKSALVEAEKRLKENRYWPNDTLINYYAITNPCEDAKSLQAVAIFREKYDINVIFGPNCAAGNAGIYSGIVTAGLLASYYKIPINSISVLDALQDRTKYQTLFRVAFTSGPLGVAILQLMDHFRWYHLALIRNHNAECTTGLSGVFAYMAETNIQLQVDLYAESIDDIRAALKVIKNHARVILLCFGWDPLSAQTFFNEAQAAGMVSDEYVYITPVYGQPLRTWKPWQQQSLGEKSKFLLLESYKSAIVIEPIYPKEQDLFLNKISNLTKLSLLPTEIFATSLLHDAFYLYGIAANISFDAGINVNNGTEILKSIRFRQFQGITGLITMNSVGDRIPQYHVSAFSTNHNDVQPFYVATYNVDTHIFDFANLNNDNFYKPPIDVPFCGFSGEHCTTDKYGILIGIFCGAFVLIAIIIIGCCWHRKFIVEKRRLALYHVWKINLADLQANPICRDSISDASFISHNSVLNVWGDQNSFICNNENKYSTPTTTRAYYNENAVIVNEWDKNRTPNLTQSLLLHLKDLKSLQHKNLNEFIGAHLVVKDRNVLLWAFCSKGCLSKILFNQEIGLDETFKSSLLRDVIRGLAYLHKSPIGYHGDLHIENCLLTSNWVVKLSGYGTDMIFPPDYDQFDKTLHFHKLFHVAPECLKKLNTEVNKKQTDVYGLSMIMYQLYFRKKLYWEINESPCNIVERIIKNDLRPLIPQSSVEFNPKLIELMKLCWNSDQTCRPRINEIIAIVNSSTKNLGNNLMDHVLSMVEKYANNLEKLVDERTQMLNEERRKTENLLYQLLPKTVAEILKRGEFVQPETFELATVYFSDIVGFTEICSHSTPMQVVAMLNQLYSGVDALMSHYKVYKVETIGDAYMVVSGLPEINVTNHATEIAEMSLDVLRHLKNFTVGHIPDKNLEMRIGINSGSVVAGVVGLTMPKYCLFGDSVNMASRMETTGLPGKIHISESTAHLLENTGRYLLTRRGKIEIKGKGMCTTYWLNIEDKV